MFNQKEFHKLENKSIIKIFGKDKFSFIQGIISNDVEILKKKSSIYSFCRNIWYFDTKKFQLCYN